MWTWIPKVGQWLVRLFGGWLPLGTKPVSEWLGKILWAIGIFLLCTIVYNKFTKPTTSNSPHQEAESITNIYHQEAPKASFGCASLKVIEYYQKAKQAVPAKDVKK
jgi:hypothetical protein